MTKTVEIRIPKENMIIVCTEGSLQNKLYQLGREQGKLDLAKKIEKTYGWCGEEHSACFKYWLKSQTQPRVECSRPKATQLSEKRVLSEVSSQESSKEGEKDV
jgi:hypothetical protein